MELFTRMDKPSHFFKGIVDSHRAKIFERKNILCALATLREKYFVQTRFLLGPAGSGKTFRCLAEIRAALKASPEGPPLILLAPKQATFQLERQLLADETLPGYTRLQILSFERLADFILTKLQRAPSKLLSEEGRVMVLRALLSQNKDKLKIFRSSARMPGFAQQLSLILRELQRHELSSATLLKLSKKVENASPLNAKLHDFGLLLDAYFGWLKRHQLQDANCLLDLAADALRVEKKQTEKIQMAGLWLDGFAEMTPQEINLLAALIPSCNEATLAFCLDHTLEPEKEISALSIWSAVSKTFQECFARLNALPDCKIEIENLQREAVKNRFAESAPLAHLEKNWAAPEAFIPGARLCPKDQPQRVPDAAADAPHTAALRLAACSNPEGEAILAAHEILRFVRKKGGRFREVAVLLRQFDGYHDALRRIFSRYEIPFFLDRRESVAHHPLAELTRSALRLVTFGWEHDDWFCALKTGLVADDEIALDQLENESLQGGWKKDAWLHPLKFTDEEKFLQHLERLRERLVPPFQKLGAAMSAHKFMVNGAQLAEAIRVLWDDLKIQEKLDAWAKANSFHTTVWEQMQDWLENIAQAFSDEPLRVSDWLPILESGLSGMTVGVIPPALDQVLIGTIDRSRNPDLRLAFVLGLNESIFPAPSRFGNLLTETDHTELAKQNVQLGPNKLELLGRERFYGYIACTRARERLVLTCSMQDGNGRALNPSLFFSLLNQLFPSLEVEKFSPSQNWFESEHRCELIAPLIQTQIAGSRNDSLVKLAELPAFDSLRKELSNFSSMAEVEKLSPKIVEQLYGDTLKSSVSALEQYAACPFRFFVSAGLRAEERKVFELDVREQGSFQHAVLAEFHEQLSAENKRWRDVPILEAREKISHIARELKISFRDGLLGSNAQSDFSARSMTESLQDFIETIVGWMSQYEFDPHVVELGFGTKEKLLPAWEIDLGESHKLAFRGVIDRVDICPLPGGDEALAVVIDYKSSARQIDPVLFANGLQLQLPAYLALLQRLPNPENIFGMKRLVPAGVFYVNLRGKFSGGKTREEVLSNIDESRHAAYQHAGRFDFAALRRLDNRDAQKGDQFNYRLKKDGEPYANSNEIMPPENFAKLLADVEQQLVRIGQEIFSGNVKVDPYQKGNIRACDQCEYQAVCRIDPWIHPYRVLK
ncbi:MAG: PD-(D/E)XK nuclease family protein [Verrucomicrobiota bacterium]